MPTGEALAALLSGPSAPAGAVVGFAGPAGRELAAGGGTRPGGKAVTTATRFDIASVTKVVTTCALHRLTVLEQLRLTDPIDQFLPGTPCTPGTTLTDLLQHRGGLWEWQPLYLAADPARALASLPLRYRPGQGRHYSDLGFMLLGQVVATVTGMSLREAVRVLVSEPLGLSGLDYGPASGDVAAGGDGDLVEQQMVRTGVPYPVLFDDAGFDWRDGPTEGDANDGNAFHACAGVSGHAGLFGTADDLLTLALSLATPGQDQLWGTGVRAEVFADGPDVGQALGWRSLCLEFGRRRRRMLWHPGFTGCAVGFVPGGEFAVVMLTNRLFAQQMPETTTLWTSVLANMESGPGGQGGWTR